jgi:sugar/nucleoside kinase (ribokinase family)
VTTNFNSVGGLVTIGHAIVDVLGHVDDPFLDHHSLVKGSMELIGADRAVPLYGAMAESVARRDEILLQISGGSAANTAVVASMLGASTSFFGKVRDDELGHVFAHDLAQVGVAFPTAMAAVDTSPTGRCLITVTPDAERTMSTFLGAARGLRVPDMHEDILSTASVTYVEGYLWDEVAAHEALELAISMVRNAGRRFSFTLSDSFLVDRFRDEFHMMIPEKVDILFANETELCSMFETDDFEKAVKLVSPMCEITTVTRGPRGSIVIHGGDVIAVDAHPVDRVVDTTGAGDAYAGGFLAGFTQGLPLDRCAVLGNLAAAEVIARLGGRPSEELFAHAQSL